MPTTPPDAGPPPWVNDNRQLTILTLFRLRTAFRLRRTSRLLVRLQCQAVRYFKLQKTQLYSLLSDIHHITTGYTKPDYNT